ncbi:DNA translocase FtsK 4TM domain-containing protein, partial [Proteus columbae]|uniref:DNA translocase FtsK 4TM domain-containing protein n=1 Tax=Proteus columbae TaxID=1987580 RepID=UPI0034D3F1C9
MSQEYTEDKNIRLTKISNRRRIWEAILILIGIGAVFLMVSLLSFHPSDPSWSQTTWNEPIQNLGGSIGAWLADILFSAFGLLAYAIPVVVVFGCWNSLRYQQNREYTDFFSLALRTIGALALIFTSCALADLNFDDIYNFSSGGVIGSLFSKALLPWFNVLGATLALLSVWAIGFTLFTGWSWLTITEKIGAVILGSVGFITNRGQNEADYEDEEEEDDTQDVVTELADNLNQKENQQSELATEESDDILFSAPSALELARQQEIDTLQVKAEQEDDLPSFSATNDIADEHAQTLTQADPLVPATVSQPTHTEEEPEHYRFDIPEAFLKKEAQSEVNAPSSSVYSIPEKNIPSVMPFDNEPMAQPSSISTDSVMPARAEPTFSLAPDTDSLTQAATVAAGVAATSALVSHGSQVKQGLGPELPRPNPVRLPTRRELYGIHIPSQREAELRRREEAVQSESEDELADIQEQANFEQELRQQFLEQQRERYGENDSADPEAIIGAHQPNITTPLPSFNHQQDDYRDEPTVTANTFSSTEENNSDIDEDEQYQQQLAAQFKQQLQDRYGDDVSLDDNEDEVLPQISTSAPSLQATTGYQPHIQHSFASQSAQPTQTIEKKVEYPASNAFLQISPRDEEEEEYSPKIELERELTALEAFSPIDDLLDEDPIEPVFTPIVSEPVTPQAVPQSRIEPQPNMAQHF